jgi:putative alpha-1,2-mannosidase
MPISLPKWMTCCPAAKRQNQLTDQAPTTSSPVTGDATADPAARASSYRLEVMELSPHSLRLHLLRYRCTLELVPTERCAIMRLTFAESGSVTLQIDLRGTDAELHAEMASGAANARMTENQGGVPKGFATYYAIKLDRPLNDFDVKNQDELRTGILRFNAQVHRIIAEGPSLSFNMTSNQ